MKQNILKPQSCTFATFARIGMMLLSLTMALVSCQVANAAVEEVGMSVMFHTNRCDIDTCLGNNSQSLAEIRRFVDAVAGDSSVTVTRVTISGYASPEGPTKLNDRLARERMSSMEQIVMGGG